MHLERELGQGEKAEHCVPRRIEATLPEPQARSSRSRVEGQEPSAAACAALSKPRVPSGLPC